MSNRLLDVLVECWRLKQRSKGTAAEIFGDVGEPCGSEPQHAASAASFLRPRVWIWAACLIFCRRVRCSIATCALPPPPPVSASPLSISQSIPTISGLWAGLFVCVCLFHGLSESSAISCIVLPLIEPKSGPQSGMAVCSLVCVCVYVCVFVCDCFSRTLCSSGSQISLRCIVALCLCSARRHSYRKTHCKQGKVCALVLVCVLRVFRKM